MTKPLDKLTRFAVKNQEIQYLDKYFIAFKNIEDLEISNCHITFKSDDPEPLLTQNSLRRLAMVNNTFSSSISGYELRIFSYLINSLTVNNQSIVRFVDNDFPIGKATVKDISLISAVRELSLRGSWFEDYSTPGNLFINFTNLQVLDLGNTRIPNLSGGVLKGLPSLEILYLDGNKLHDLTTFEFFEGLIARNLSYLDVSDNNLREQPKGDEYYGKNLLHYDLSGNQIEGSVFNNRSQNFPKLQWMSQANNIKTTVLAKRLANMVSLKFWDISCNNFSLITTDFFAEAPKSLEALNLTFCCNSERDRPRIVPGAFSSFPPVKELFLGGGYFRANVLLRLQVCVHILCYTIFQDDLSRHIIVF